MGYLITAIVAAGLFPLPVWSQEANDPCSEGAGCFEVLKDLPKFGKSIDSFINATGDKPLLTTVDLFTAYIAAAIVAAGMIIIIFGGYLYMTAGGNSTQLDTAKKYIAAALIGITLALTAWLVLNTISTQFTPTTDPVPPQSNTGTGP